MYLVSVVIFTASNVLIGGAPNIAAVIIGRFIAGCASSTGSTMVGGTIADIWVTSQRGKPMAMFSLAAFAGTGLGPTTLGYVAQNVGWRWTQYIQAIVSGVLTVVFVVVLRETRGSVILSRKAKKLRQETGDDKWQCEADGERAGLVVLIKVSLSRPMYLLFTEPVVFFFSLWISFVWGVMVRTSLHSSASPLFD